MLNPLGISRKTPIFSPDLYSETCPVSRSGIVRESLMISRFFDIYSKPGLCPESQYSPRNPARQQIFSKKEEGGLSDCTSRRKEWFSGEDLTRTFLASRIFSTETSLLCVPRASSLAHQSRRRYDIS